MRGLLVLAVLVAACSGPVPTVDRITLANPTDFDIAVEVSGRDREGWLPLANVGARSEHDVQQVIDQGDAWVFRFLHWGDPVGELSLTREELAQGDWRVEVPDQLQARLEQLGRPPAG
jgi:hypothetical protein